MRRVAELYYEQSLSQQEIARLLDCSHSTVSRLLADARSAGIVQISIQKAVESDSELSRHLRETFSLRDAVVTPAGASPQERLTLVGDAGAELLMSVLDEGMIIGVTWGNTLYHMVRAIQPVAIEGVQVIQLSGALGQGDPEVDGPNLAFRLAEHLGGTCRLLPAPALVDTPQFRDQLMDQRQIRDTITAASRANVIVQGIGALDDDLSSLERAGYIDKSEADLAKRQGAVGHVFARMIDAEGREVGDYGRRVVGISLEAMRDADWSICLCASPAKAKAVLGALRGRYFNTLVVDATTAEDVLALAAGKDALSADSRSDAP